MGTIIKKTKKNGAAYWYYVESGRVDGRPRITRQVYLGTAEKIVAELQLATRPLPLRATTRAWGLPGALWLAAQDSGLWADLGAIWAPPRAGPSLPHYLLLAAIHRVCAPGPKTAVADWYAHSVLAEQWRLPPERFTSPAIWDAFDQVDQERPFPADDLSRAQLRVLARWRQNGWLGSTILGYDTTNFYTHIDSKNDRCTVARRGHNKQKRHDLRPVGLAYLVDAASGLGLYHHVYPGNVADQAEFAVALPQLLAFLEHAALPRRDVTLTFDKGPADLVNILELESQQLGWVAAVPWSQVPPALQAVGTEQLQPCSARLPGLQLYGADAELWGGVRRCVVVHSSTFFGEQFQSLTTALARAAGRLKATSRELARVPARPWTEEAVRAKLARQCRGQWLGELLVIDEVREAPDHHWAVQFHVDQQALWRLSERRLGRTIIASNRREWSDEELVLAYHGQSGIEREFRAVKDGVGCSWGPMFHWTDHKIRVHAFTIMLGLSLVNWLLYRLHQAEFTVTREQLVAALVGIEDVVLAYPPGRGAGRPATVQLRTYDTLEQRRLAELLGLERLGSRGRR